MMARQRVKATVDTAFLAAVAPAHGSAHIVVDSCPCTPFFLVAGGVAMSMAWRAAATEFPRADQAMPKRSKWASKVT